MIGSIIDRVHLFKFFLCYELLFIIISIILVLHSYTIECCILVLFLIWNSVFEIILGFNSLFI